MWIANAEHSKNIDRRAQEEFGLSSQELMEEAGTAVYREILRRFPDCSSITIFCGKGNNGGDGLVVARLAAFDGYSVDCLVCAKKQDLTEASKAQMDRLEQSNLEPIFIDDEDYAVSIQNLGWADLIVDALLGTGAKGDVTEPYRSAIEVMNASGKPIVSIDIPSGIDTDTGHELGTSVKATYTVSIGLPKPFLFLDAGLENAGYWSVEPINFPEELLNEETDCLLVELVGWNLPIRKQNSHKGDNGRLLVVAGSQRMPGAATLCVKAALRSGIGLVTIAAPPCVCDSVSNQIPEATLLPLPSPKEAVAIITDAQERFNAAIFGPGLTTDSEICQMLSDIWQAWKKPCLIDADALNAISLGTAPPDCDVVMTPHPGEAARLLGCSIDDIQKNRFTKARELTSKYHKTVLLKGAHSLIAISDKPLAVNSTGNPGMACGGMGDVLSGVVGTLIAQGLTSYDAAVCGAYWHGLAGDVCAEEIGAIGYTASDVVNALPQTRAKIVTSCE